jgi:phospholipase/carboxylesterase
MTDLSLIHLSRPAAAGDAPYPGLVLLHGLGSNELDLHGIATQLDPRFFAVSARAPYPYEWGGYAWYDLAEGAGLGSPQIEASLRQIRDFLVEIVDAYPIDPHRLYVGGFSQGAAMAGATALLHPDLAAGAIMISGYLPPPDSEHRYDADAAAGHPFFQAHGTLDQVVPLTYAWQTREFLERTPVALTYREYPIGHEVSLAELQDLSSWLQKLPALKPAVELE